MGTTPKGNRQTHDSMGKLVPTMPVRELSMRKWDSIVVGAGHNGLTCAAYLARSGRQVLVLEARQRVGGACTIDEVWPGYRISPCAYLVGLLHPLVIDELDMAEYGFAWYPATAGTVRPVRGRHAASSSGTTTSGARKRSAGSRAGDLDGWRDFCVVKARLRDALRPAGDGDLWIGRAPTLDEIEETARRRHRGPSDAVRVVDGRVRRELLQG